MHPEILNNDQNQLLPLVKLFRREFYLVGGTAIALQAGHRESVDFDKYVYMPDLLTLSAMKAFALGRRSKWKDYVDLYFLLKDYVSISQIEQKAKSIYGQEFSEKLFRAQLSYHADIDYAEKVRFLPGFEVEPEEVKQFLIDVSIKI